MTYSQNKNHQRRDNKIIRLSLIILSVFVLSHSESLIKVPVVGANLIGIDFGSTFIKATLVRPGKKFEIVENTASMRKTQTMVTIGKDNRLYGADSFLESGKYPFSTLSEMQGVFGVKYDSELIQKMKENRFITNEFVSDERGFVAWKVTRPALGDQEAKQEIIYSEEVISMLLSYFKMLAEKTAEGRVGECVITVPSWFSYDQRLMIKDAAEKFAGLSVLQLVHENTAAAVLFGIDKVSKEAQNHNVLFYNMGGMHTEVSIVSYSHLNVSNKIIPYIQILAESTIKNLGSSDFDIVLVNLLAEKFNKLKEREGKEDVRKNIRALKRLQKEVIKVKEILSANKAAFVKIPELLDYVTLQLQLEREEFESAAAQLFEKVLPPVEEALLKAGITKEQINQVELLGGGIRVPKVTDILEKYLNNIELGVHLNGDEAMCFGSAFIGSNSTANFKVAQVLLTQNPDFDVKIKISPIDPNDILTEEEQKQEGIEEEDIIKYTQELRLFNSSDYYGKSKGLTMNYNKNMKIEIYKIQQGAPLDSEDAELLDTYHLEDIKQQYENDIKYKQSELEREKKRKEKLNSNSTNDTKKEESKTDGIDDKELSKIEKPKLKFSIELSRSGYVSVPKANIGNMFVEIKHIRKPSQLTEEQISEARLRLKWYQKRDDDKIKNDISKNDLEALIYKMREWLNEESNQAYVEQKAREDHIQYLSEVEDWLYGDGVYENHTVYSDKRKGIDKDFQKYRSIQIADQKRQEIISGSEQAMESLEKQIEDLKEIKPWITDEEFKDILDSISEFRVWLKDLVSQQEKLAKHEEPILKEDDVFNKVKRIANLYQKVSKKKKPRPPTSDKKDEKKEEQQNDEKKDEEKADQQNSDQQKEKVDL